MRAHYYDGLQPAALGENSAFTGCDAHAMTQNIIPKLAEQSFSQGHFMEMSAWLQKHLLENFAVLP